MMLCECVKGSFCFRQIVPSFTHDTHAPASIAEALAKRNIFVWNGHNYALELVKALGIFESGGTVRVGAVHYNSISEIDLLLNALEDVLG